MSRNEEFHNANSAYLHEVRNFDGEPHHLAGWHMTDNPDFQYDRNYEPSDHIGAGSKEGSLYYTANPLNWGSKRYHRPYAAEVWVKGKPKNFDIEDHDLYDAENWLHPKRDNFRIGAVVSEHEARANSPITERPTSGSPGGAINHVLSALHYSARYPGAPVRMSRGDEVKTVRYRRAVK